MDTCHGVPNHGGTKFICQIVLMWRYATPWYQITGDFIPQVPNFWGYQITMTAGTAGQQVEASRGGVGVGRGKRGGASKGGRAGSAGQ